MAFGGLRSKEPLPNPPLKGRGTMRMADGRWLRGAFGRLNTRKSIVSFFGRNKGCKSHIIGVMCIIYSPNIGISAILFVPLQTKI